MARRLVLVPFALIQGSIVLRILLLLLDARTTNVLVHAVMQFSAIFIGPFVGLLHTNSVHYYGSTLDLAAVAALIGWTIFEMLVIAVLALFPD